MPNTLIKPTWSEYEKDLHSDDAEKATRAGEAFELARKKEMAVSAKARDWEESRKKEWVKAKPEFTKKRLTKEKEALSAITQKLRTGGKFNSPLKPMPGYLIVLPDPAPERTESGLFMVYDHDLPGNSGTVLAIGDRRIDLHETLEPPVKPGAHILYKRGAGLELKLQGENVLLQQWSDILGEFDA